MSRKTTSAKALGRSYGTERALTFAVGLAAVVVGGVVFAVSLGWFGQYRAERPVLDPIALDWLGRQPTLAKILALLVGVVALVGGVWWLVRSLRPEGRPDLELDSSPEAALTVTASAIAGAVQADAETVDGVSRARARAVGDVDDPALRLTLWLQAGTDVKKVWEELDTRVLARAREALGMDVLPTAVHLELDTGARRRVQ
jgi:hypothetical protein